MKIDISLAVAALTGVIVWQEYRISNLHQTNIAYDQKIDDLNHTVKTMANTQSVTQESIELETAIRQRDVEQLQTKGAALVAPAENLFVADESELVKWDRLWIVYGWYPG